jgi:hypothetical protein
VAACFRGQRSTGVEVRVQLADPQQAAAATAAIAARLGDAALPDVIDVS